jgi:adenylate cyclase
VAEQFDREVQIHARGSGVGEYVWTRLGAGQTLRVGRAPQQGWAVPWDPRISREHADLTWLGDRLQVTSLATARNPLLFSDGAHRAIRVADGESFQIGRTTFQVVLVPSSVAADRNAETHVTVQPRDLDPSSTSADIEPPGEILSERSYTTAELRRARFDNAEKQMELLARLPELIASTSADEDLAQQLVRLLLEAIPQAAAAAVAQYEMAEVVQGDREAGRNFDRPKMMRIETHPQFTGRFQPSRRLIATTLCDQRSVVQIWGSESGSQFTMTEGLGWAIAAPIPGDSCRGWCLYVSGKGGRSGSMLVSEEDLAGDLRFTELVAQFIGSIRQVRMLQEHRTQLSTFFSPHVVESLIGSPSQDLLTPAERDITVLFCDVRGFSRQAEQLQDQLPRLLESVRAALGVMVNCIIERDGTIADLQGDAALGFWGWPVSLPEGPLPACRAALAIDAEFRRSRKPLQGIAIGLGISHGTALAGQIGTMRHPKLGVFGPVVNQGARLEGMTRQFGVSICVDAATADAVRTGLPPSEARLRSLGRVLPKGMQTPLTAYSLLPPEHAAPEITPAVLENHAAALEALTRGRWTEAAGLLETLPADDGPATFLRSFLAQHHQTPPPDWQGVICLATK